MHSRGPWRAALGKEYKPKEGEDRTEIACLPHYRYDALDVFGPDLGRQITYEELEGNARLIAAAPDLLEALESALEVVNVAEGMTSCRGDDDWIWGVQKKINEAISKAKGE